MKLVTAITSVIAVVGFLAAGFLFKKDQLVELSRADIQGENAKFESTLTDIQTKNTELDKELFAYENTEIAKEVELLRLKLSGKEKDLAVSQKETSDLKERNTSITANIKKARVYIDVIDEINKVYLGKPPPPQWDLGGIDVKVAVANDSELSGYWKTTKNSTDIDIVPGEWLPDNVGKVLARAISKIYTLLR